MIPDLAPRFDASLEWWFVHGRLEAETGGTQSFMCAVFRRASPSSAGDGHMLLLSAFDEAEGRHTVRSEVSPEMVEHFLRDAPTELTGAGINPNLVAAFTAEIARSGVPSPVGLATKPASVAADRFEIGWGDVCLAQSGSSLGLNFRMPGNGAPCELTARPTAEWLRDEDFAGLSETMAYQSCPRLAVSGKVDGTAVRGEAWIDHQWGGHGWLMAPGTETELLGWDWIGINLDGGADLIAMVRRNVQSGEVVSRFAVLFAPGEAPHIVDDVAITARRQWVSRRSMIAYPVECRIGIPSLDIDLVFHPAADDQEIPLFGITNAIWEGIGRVTGTLGGRAVAGRARLELNGYGLILDFRSYQHRWIDRIEATMLDFLPRELDEDRLAAYAGQPRWRLDAVAQTEMLATPVWDLVSRGGKHWRPIYGLMLLEALGTEVAPYETLMTVTAEFIHNGSVIVDDIEDSSLTRRGEPAIHLRYGLPTAINAGNQLYFLPLLALSEHPALTPGQRDAIYRALVRMFVQAHMGQAQDLYWSRPGSPRGEAFWTSDRLPDRILQAHAYKSAAAVRAISEVACIIAGADTRVTEAATDFGESWGVAFQIFDDIRNFTREPEWGKTRGEDVAAGKVTWVTARAANLLDGAERTELIRILENPDLRTSEVGLQRGIALIERSGALAASRTDATALVEASWPSLAEALPQTMARIMLRILVTHLLDSIFEM